MAKELSEWTARDLVQVHGRHTVCSLLWHLERKLVTGQQVAWMPTGRKHDDAAATDWCRGVFREVVELIRTELPSLIPAGAAIED